MNLSRVRNVPCLVRNMLLAALVTAGCATGRAIEPGAAAAATRAGQGKTPFVYVSGFGGVIDIFHFDAATGALAAAGKADSGPNASFLAFAPNGKTLYAVNENAGGKVVSFRIDQATGALFHVNEESSMGVGPAHISVDRTGHFVLVANYAKNNPGTIAVLPIGDDGSLLPASFVHDFGVNLHPHYISTDPGNRFVLVPCLGGPYVAQFRFDATNGKLVPSDPDRIAAAPGAGPRHLDFHRSLPFAYVVNELNSTLSAYRYDATSGHLTEIYSTSTLPPDFSGRNTGADIHVHPSGKFVYSSNRGHDSIAIFGVDQATGRVSLLGHETRTIKTPRNFHIDPSGTFLLVASQSADIVTVFRIDAQKGTLEPVGDPVPVSHRPSFVGVVYLPGA